jgi:hypothetical protein
LSCITGNDCPWASVTERRSALPPALRKERVGAAERQRQNNDKLALHPDCNGSPSVAPRGPDQDTYLVLDDFGWIGLAWRETDEEHADREALIRDLFAGDYNNPVRIIAFNTAEGWSRDVTVDIGDEVRRRYVEYDEIPGSVLALLEATNRR